MPLKSSTLAVSMAINELVVEDKFLRVSNFSSSDLVKCSRSHARTVFMGRMERTANINIGHELHLASNFSPNLYNDFECVYSS